MKRRALVLTDERARHPFLMALPPHVRLSPVEGWPEDAPSPATSWRITATDVRQFLLAYCACFLAVSVFLL